MADRWNVYEGDCMAGKMTEKKKKPRVFWVVEGTLHMPTIHLSKQGALDKARYLKYSFTVESKIIKVQEVPCRKKK